MAEGGSAGYGGTGRPPIRSTSGERSWQGPGGWMRPESGRLSQTYPMFMNGPGHVTIDVEGEPSPSIPITPCMRDVQVFPVTSTVRREVDRPPSMPPINHPSLELGTDTGVNTAPIPNRGRNIDTAERIFFGERPQPRATTPAHYYCKGPEKPCLNPEKYSGKAAFGDYLKQFEIVAEINYWTPHAKRIFLLAMLQGRVQEFVNDLPENIRGNYNSLCEALQNQFGAHKLVDGYRQELLCCVQGKDESVRDLGSRVRRLVSRAFPLNTYDSMESMTVHYFIHALKDSTVRLQVKRLAPPTLEQAIDGALREATIQAGERSKAYFKIQATSHSETEISTETVEKMKQEMAALKRELETFKNARPTVNRNVCWFCNTPGHQKSECERFRVECPEQYANYMQRRQGGRGRPYQGNGQGQIGDVQSLPYHH